MGRLTKRGQDFESDYCNVTCYSLHDNETPLVHRFDIRCEGRSKLIEMAKKLEEYENLQEDGRLIILKVGVGTAYYKPTMFCTHGGESLRETKIKEDCSTCRRYLCQDITCDCHYKSVRREFSTIDEIIRLQNSINKDIVLDEEICNQICESLNKAYDKINKGEIIE